MAKWFLYVYENFNRSGRCQSVDEVCASVFVCAIFKCAHSAAQIYIYDRFERTQNKIKYP